ncbi:MAG: CYTH domain-containing protein [Sphingobacteriales bacterium]|uniref:class IV adenylate cyclase n=1 Tax=Hydrotalea flava TaxID=714549 RepID=UPI00082B5BEC|nr:class IV adenylate cyclase [Hydrotalea flava]RTL53257.1 MAG: CYTH domain-containing protein [Sphingobacteriales bacterium]
MAFINIEIKAKCFHPEKVEAFLVSAGADFKGIDFQKDTYFKVENGRLKLRQGNIENNLIYYERSNLSGPKPSYFQLVQVKDSNTLLDMLTRAIGKKIVVDKKRKIFFIENVKFHIDEVVGLGFFVEIEASNLLHPEKTEQELQAQCAAYMDALNIHEEELLQYSYSDMLMEIDLQ